MDKNFDYFAEALSKTMENEGVFPADGKTGLYFADGFHTNFGIAYEFNRRRLGEFGIVDPDQIDKLTFGQAAQIYREKYWSGSPAAYIQNQKLAESFFDFAVNVGRARSWRYLARLCNRFNHRLDKALEMPGKNLDTIYRLKFVLQFFDELEVAKTLDDLRIRYYRKRYHLMEKDGKAILAQRFFLSWERRLDYWP
jgi:hypothetical protein